VRGKTADRIIRAGIIKIMPHKLFCTCGAHSVVTLNGNQMYGGYVNLLYRKGLFSHLTAKRQFKHDGYPLI